MDAWNSGQHSRLITAFANVFFTINYSFNFYCYCLANQEIRQAVFKLLSSTFSSLQEMWR